MSGVMNVGGCHRHHSLGVMPSHMFRSAHFLPVMFCANSRKSFDIKSSVWKILEESSHMSW